MASSAHASHTPRALWKGAISFGLVHIPVALHSATREGGIDFDWLDKRTLDPVGYRRINKKTGEEIDKENIVKGIAVEAGHYVVLSDDEIRDALPRSTQSIDIESFVRAEEIPPAYFERPYFLAPAGKGSDKVYALLREALVKSGRVGIARVVIQSKQHLAALRPAGAALELVLLRWHSHMREVEDLGLPVAGSAAAGISRKEMEMAVQLVEDLAAPWAPEQFADSFTDKVMALVDRKVRAGETESVAPVEAPLEAGAEVIDLAELLRRSLRGGDPPKTTKAAADGEAGKDEKEKKPARRTPAGKEAAKPDKPASRRRSA